MNATATKLNTLVTNAEARAALRKASLEFNLPYQASGYSFPMDFFEANEELIRRVKRPHSRVWYRGPRVSYQPQARGNKATCTRRCDAVAVIVSL